MAWSRPYFGGAFFRGGFFGGTGTTAGWGVLAKEWRRRDDEDVARAREEFGSIPAAARRAIDAVARRHAMAAEWDEEAMKEELMHALRGTPWSSHYIDALYDALDDERARVTKLMKQMEFFRIAPCAECGSEAAELGVDEGRWSVVCQECGAQGAEDEQPIVAVRGWNGRT